MDTGNAEIFRRLVAGTAEVATQPKGVLRMTFAFVGERACPPPAGLTVGSTRDPGRTILGA